jgi:hypothetical protein
MVCIIPKLLDDGAGKDTKYGALLDYLATGAGKLEVKQENENGQLLLHTTLLVKSTPPLAVIQAIIDAFPEALAYRTWNTSRSRGNYCIIKSPLNDMPLPCALLSNNDEDVILMMLERIPALSELRYWSGNLPLYNAIRDISASLQVRVIKKLVQLYPCGDSEKSRSCSSLYNPHEGYGLPAFTVMWHTLHKLEPKPQGIANATISTRQQQQASGLSEKVD